MSDQNQQQAIIDQIGETLVLSMDADRKITNVWTDLKDISERLPSGSEEASRIGHTAEALEHSLEYLQSIFSKLIGQIPPDEVRFVLADSRRKLLREGFIPYEEEASLTEVEQALDDAKVFLEVARDIYAGRI